MDEIGKNLKRIRLLKNLSLKAAGDLLNMSATAISKYEQGKIALDSTKLIEFANAYNVKTIDLLKVYDTPKMKFTSFRKKKKLTGQNLKILEELIQNEVAKYLEVIEMNNISTNYIKFEKYFCKNTEDAEKAASDFRNHIEISNRQPISDLINILENLGIIIIQVKNLDNRFNDFDGLQRFTIAHELGHLILDINNSDEEKLCNRFASALLMPKEAVISEFGCTRRNINFFELKAFKNEFKVSYAAIVYRLKDLNIISEYLYKNLIIFLSKYIGKTDPNPIQPEISYQFKKIVYKLEADEIISLNKACELLGVTLDEYNSKDNNYRY